MKEIKAIVRTERSEMVLDVLREAGVRNVQMSRVETIGPVEADPDTRKLDFEFARETSQMIKIEFFCPDHALEQILTLIHKSGCTHHPGDGIVSVVTVDRLMTVRTGENLAKDN